MNTRKNDVLAEAVKILKDNLINCPPPLEKEIKYFFNDPTDLDRALELLKESKKHAGMFNKSYICELLARVEGGYFNEAEFFAERLPGDQ